METCGVFFFPNAFMNKKPCSEYFVQNHTRDINRLYIFGEATGRDSDRHTEKSENK